ncbi:MAG: glycosyltransferase family 4 protein [Actinomycetia bacterium]|nr:glycosyltransferase family 4 protein [Actinomycetes bacterium]
MRILVVNNFFPPRVGGSSHLSESLAHQYALEGHEVLVLTAAFGDAPAEEESDRGYRVVRLPAWNLPKFGLSIDFDITFASRPSNIRRISKLLGEFQPEIVHQHGQFLDLAWLTGRWAARHDVPVLLSVHTRLENPNRLYALAFALLDYGIVRPLVNSYDPYMVVMDRKMDAYIRSRYFTREQRMVDIPVGIEVGRFARPGDGGRVREKWDLGDRPVVMSLGHVIPLRDRMLLVESLPGVVRQFPDVAVMVVGNVHFPRFLERAEELGVRDNIITTGAVPKDEIPDYLAAAQVEAHDLEGLGFGTASLEAMAAGVPVVAAVHVDNFRGIELRDGDNVVLVSEGRPAELSGALSKILSNPDAAQHVAEEGQKLIHEYFTIEAVAAKHLEAFERITGT